MRFCALQVIALLEYLNFNAMQHFTNEYRKRGNFHWTKFLRYPQYMDFHSNTFVVQGRDQYMFS